MAKTAAERMQIYRERQRLDRKASPVEVFLKADTLQEAKARAATKELPLRQYLLERIVAGMEAEGMQPEAHKTAVDFLGALPFNVYAPIDDEYGRLGGGDLVAMLGELLLDGLRHRGQLEPPPVPEQPKEHEKPVKKSTGKRQKKVVS